MNAERFNELATLHAVGALDGAELREFETLAATVSPALKAEVAQWQDTAALLAVASISARPAAPAVKAKIMARIKPGPSVPPAQNQNPFYSITREEGEWATLPVPGVRVKTLAEDTRRGLSTKLYELAPGVHFPGHHHSGPEECFVLSGDFHVEGRVLHGGDFHHAEPHSDHGESFTVNGCTLLVMAVSDDYK